MSSESKSALKRKQARNNVEDESLCEDSVKKLVQNLEPVDRDILARLSREFFNNQLSVVQAKIDAHAQRVDRHYAPGVALPEDEQILMEIYQIEKALLQELGQDDGQGGEGKLFVEAGCKRLEETLKRLSELQGRENSTLRRQKVTRAWVEIDYLLRLVNEWYEAMQEILGQAV